MFDGLIHLLASDMSRLLHREFPDGGSHNEVEPKVVQSRKDRRARGAPNEHGSSHRARVHASLPQGLNNSKLFSSQRFHCHRPVTEAVQVPHVCDRRVSAPYYADNQE